MTDATAPALHDLRAIAAPLSRERDPEGYRADALANRANPTK
jgi:hypothetical protein